MEQKYQEADFEEEVKWDHSLETEFVCKLIQDRKDSEYDPVGEPVLVILEATRLQCLERLKCRVHNSDAVGDDRLEGANQGEEEHNSQQDLQDLLYRHAQGQGQLFEAIQDDLAVLFELLLRHFGYY